MSMSARSPGGGLHGPFVPQLRVVRHVARVQDVVRRSRAPPPPLPPLPRACPVDPPPVADARRSIHPATRRSSPSQTSSKVRVVRPRLVVPSPTTPARIRLFWAVSKLRRDWIFDERAPTARAAGVAFFVAAAPCSSAFRALSRQEWAFSTNRSTRLGFSSRLAQERPPSTSPSQSTSAGLDPANLSWRVSLPCILAALSPPMPLLTQTSQSNPTSQLATNVRHSNPDGIFSRRNICSSWSWPASMMVIPG